MKWNSYPSLPLFSIAMNYLHCVDSSSTFMCPAAKTGMITWSHKQRLPPLMPVTQWADILFGKGVFFPTGYAWVLEHVLRKNFFMFPWMTWIRLHPLLSARQKELHHCKQHSQQLFFRVKYPSLCAALIRSINMGCCLSPVLAILLRHCCSLSCSKGWKTLDIVLHLRFLSLFQMLDLRSLAVTMPQ